MKEIMAMVFMGYATLLVATLIICDCIKFCVASKRVNDEVDEKFIEYLDSMIEKSEAE